MIGSSSIARPNRKKFVPATCRDELAAFEQAKRAKKEHSFWEALVSKSERRKRKSADQMMDEAKKALKKCEEENSAHRGVLASRAMARLSNDIKLPFALKAGFHKNKKQAHNDIKRKLKIRQVGDAVEKINKQAKKDRTDKILQHAIHLETLDIMKSNTKKGFLAANIAATVASVAMDVFAPGVGSTLINTVVGQALSQGEKLAIGSIDKDIAKAEVNYKKEISSFQAEKKKLAEEKKRKEEEAKARQKKPAVKRSKKKAPEEKKSSMGLWLGIGAGALALVGGYLVLRKK